MTAVKLTLWSEGRDPSECGIAVNGKQIIAEDLEEVASREEAEALGIPVTCTTIGKPSTPTGPLHWWLEEQAN